VQVAEHGGVGPEPGGESRYLPPPTESFGAMVRADFRQALVVLLLAALTSVPLGWLWSRLAPPMRVIVVRDDGLTAPLQAESYHRFDDLVVFALLGLAAGLVIGVTAWFLHRSRGPAVLLAAVLGSALAAWLAMKIGVALAESRYPEVVGGKVRDLFEVAPRLESPWVVLAQPLAAALAYGIGAAWHGQDDLGKFTAS
jgi:hypothetical protein